MSKKDHKKLERECFICKEKPAYFSRFAGNYVCMTHQVHYARKALALIAVGAVIFLILSII